MDYFSVHDCASLYGQYCPVVRAAEILVDRWTVLIVRDLLADRLRNFRPAGAPNGFCGTLRVNEDAP